MKVKLLCALILFTSQFSFHKQLKVKWSLIIMQSLKSKSLILVQKHLQFLMQMENFQLLQNEWHTSICIESIK
jgi:hypothetical protein